MAWIASLSNGETLIEGKVIAGERTPWQKLLSYCKANDLKITGIRLQVGDVEVRGMPHKMCDGYMQAYETRRTFYTSGANDKTSQGIGSVVGDQVYITWIDLKPINGAYQIHQDIRPLSQVDIHTMIN
jgi:hypothetical protein